MNRMNPDPKQEVVNTSGQVQNVEKLVVTDDTTILFTVGDNTSAPSFLIGYVNRTNLKEY